MVVLITGDREWEGDDPTSPLFMPSRMMMHEFLQSLPWDAVVREGCARGADHAAETLCKSMGLTVEHFPADWDRHNKSAGAIRNREMYWGNHGTGGVKVWIKPEIVAAFHNHIRKSKGTADMIEVAKVNKTEWKLYALPETGKDKK